MSVIVDEMNVLSTDGIHTLKGKVYSPEGIKRAKGFFQIVHGMTEHIDRYDEFMRKIAENGYICFGFNNLGHKDTAEENELGFIAEKGGYKYLIDDVATFYAAVSNKYRAKKYILMGHSMGSFIARLFAEKYSGVADALIICGTGNNCLSALAGVGIAKLIQVIKGPLYYSVLLDKIILGFYNVGFKGDTRYEWLTKDRKIIENRQKDKYCTFRFKVSAIKDLLMLTYRANRKKWYENIDKNLPILLISGDKDPVGAKGRGVTAIFKKLRRMGSKDVNVFLYKDCRHEILNDSCKDETISDIIDFIE